MIPATAPGRIDRTNYNGHFISWEFCIWYTNIIRSFVARRRTTNTSTSLHSERSTYSTSIHWCHWERSTRNGRTIRDTLFGPHIASDQFGCPHSRKTAVTTLLYCISQNFFRISFFHASTNLKSDSTSLEYSTCRYRLTAVNLYLQVLHMET